MKKMILGFGSLLCSMLALAQSDTVNLSVSEEEMLALMSKPSSTFVLPEFSVYNRVGKRVFYKQSLPGNFKRLLLSALQQAKATEHSILSQAGSFIEHKTKAPYSIPYQEYDYVFVEYWAEWCKPCFQQMDIVKGVIAERNDLKILWLKVERDPAKMEGVVMEKMPVVQGVQPSQDWASLQKRIDSLNEEQKEVLYTAEDFEDFRYAQKALDGQEYPDAVFEHIKFSLQDSVVSEVEAGNSEFIMSFSTRPAHSSNDKNSFIAIRIFKPAPKNTSAFDLDLKGVTSAQLYQAVQAHCPQKNMLGNL